MGRKILYVDMDNVLVDFPAGIAQLDQETYRKYEKNYDEVPGIFGLMPPIEQAIESYEKLATWYDAYILSTAPWENPSAWHDKLLWVKKYLGKPAYKRLIISHNKHLNHGDFLVDDRPNNGAELFSGEWIHFGSEQFPDWGTVVKYLDLKK
jgi:5'(3')-deoxyribonucleotidase